MVLLPALHYLDERPGEVVPARLGVVLAYRRRLRREPPVRASLDPRLRVARDLGEVGLAEVLSKQPAIEPLGLARQLDIDHLRDGQVGALPEPSQERLNSLGHARGVAAHHDDILAGAPRVVNGPELIAALAGEQVVGKAPPVRVHRQHRAVVEDAPYQDDVRLGHRSDLGTQVLQSRLLRPDRQLRAGRLLHALHQPLHRGIVCGVLRPDDGGRRPAAFRDRRIGIAGRGLCDVVETAELGWDDAQVVDEQVELDALVVGADDELEGLYRGAGRLDLLALPPEPAHGDLRLKLELVRPARPQRAGPVHPAQHLLPAAVQRPDVQRLGRLGEGGPGVEGQHPIRHVDIRGRHDHREVPVPVALGAARGVEPNGGLALCDVGSILTDGQLNVRRVRAPARLEALHGLEAELPGWLLLGQAGRHHQQRRRCCEQA